MEDDDRRYDKFLQLLFNRRMDKELGEYGVERVTCVKDLTREHLELADMAFLDHDMCEAPMGYDEQCPNGSASCQCPDGTQMVSEIINPRGRLHLNPANAPKFIVHSANDVKGRQMTEDLLRGGYVALRADFTHWRGKDSSQLWKALHGPSTGFLGGS